VPYRELLLAYAQRAADRCRTFTRPSSSSSGRLRWVQEGNEWHLWAGKFNLYKAIHRRRMGIVNDPDLSDEPVDLG